MIRWIILTGWLLLMPGVLRAQDTLHVLRLRDALEIAYRQHPRLNQVRMELAAARARRVQALGLEYPLITYYREGIHRQGGAGFAEQRWTVEQTLPFPLAVYYQRDAAHAEVMALTREEEALRREVRRDVKKAYTEVLFARAILGLRRQEIALAEEVLRTATIRMEGGEATELDRLKAELQLAEARNNEALAEAAFHEARYGLFRTIGLRPEAQRYDIAFGDSLYYRPETLPQEEVLAQLMAHPRMQARLYDEKKAARRLQAEKVRWIPNLALSYYQQDYGTGYRFHGFQVGFRIPLWFWWKGRPKIQQARASLQQARWTTYDTQLQLKYEVEVAWHGYEAALRNIRRFQQTIEQQSSNLLQLTLEAYRTGAIDLLTLLDTQRQYLASRVRYYEALRTYYLRLIDLEFYVPQELVLEEHTP